MRSTQERNREAVFDRACVLRDRPGPRCTRRRAAEQDPSSVPRPVKDACQDAHADDATGARTIDAGGAGESGAWAIDAGGPRAVDAGGTGAIAVRSSGASTAAAGAHDRPDDAGPADRARAVPR